MHTAAVIAAKEIEKLMQTYSLADDEISLFTNALNDYRNPLPELTAVDLKNFIDEIETFCNSLKRFLMAVSWGGHESLIIPSCSFYPKESYDASVFPFNLIRFYIGLEEPEVLIEDLLQAFKIIE